MSVDHPSKLIKDLAITDGASSLESLTERRLTPALARAAATSDGDSASQVTSGGGFVPLESPDRRFPYCAKGRAEPGLSSSSRTSPEVGSAALQLP